MFTANSLTDSPKIRLINIRRMAIQGYSTQEQLMKAVEDYREYLRIKHKLCLNRMYVLSMVQQLPD